jgi:hypothetical protein
MTIPPSPSGQVARRVLDRATSSRVGTRSKQEEPGRARALLGPVVGGAVTRSLAAASRQFDPSTIGARFRCQVDAQRSCPKAVLFYPRSGCGSPRRVRLEMSRVTLKFLPAWIACIARNRYKLPTPNTSGTGPVFPAATQRNGKYRVAAKHCESIELRESHALRLAHVVGLA